MIIKLPDVIVPPKLQAWVPGEKKQIVLEDWVLEFKIDNVWKKMIVPAGFLPNGSSLPIGLIYGKWDPDTSCAYVSHDFGYGTECFPRKVLDLLYCELLIHGQIAPWKAKSAYRVLRMVGAIPYRKHRREENTIFYQHANELGLVATGTREYACLRKS